jgi:hypothetical protein
MATTLTSSDLLNIQAKLDAMFQEETPSRQLYNQPTATAKAMFMKNMANARPITDQNGKYRGVDVKWLKLGSTTADYDGDGTTPAFTVPTDLSEGTGPESDTKTYTNNVKVQKVVEVDDNDLSANMYNLPELIADRLAAATLSVRLALNSRWITFLNTNRTGVNNDSNLPDGITFDGTDDEFDVDSGVISLQDPRSLTDLDALAMNNLMGSYTYLNGRRNFYNVWTDSTYRRLNDDEREFVRFSEYDMFFDIRNLDAALTGNNTFIIQDGAYATWDYIHPTITREPTMYKDNAFQYFIEDPTLMINDNGALRPLRYNVYYQRVDQAGNGDTMRRGYTHRWEVTYNGGIWVAPPSSDGHTGILKVKTTTGV